MSESPAGSLVVGAVETAAAHWAVVLEHEAVTELEREAFEQWVLADPAHERAFLNQVAIGALVGELKPKSRSSGLRVVPSLVVPSPVVPPAVPRRPLGLAIAASALLVLVGAAMWLWPDSTDSFTTRTREQRTVQLADGSAATLNTRSALHWVGNAQDRRVVLKRGEALFDVVPDASRPFRVLVDQLEIRVVGTRFCAYRKEDGTLIVTVLSGHVSVTDHDGAGHATWSHQLHANQQLKYRPAEAPTVRAVAARKAVRWMQGQLEIDDEPLAEVLAELARYTDQSIVMVPDPRLAQLHVGGDLSVYNIDSALASLESRERIKVIRSPGNGGYTVVYREEPELESRLDVAPDRRAERASAEWRIPQVED